MRIFYGLSLAGVLTALHADTPSTTSVTTTTGSTAAASPVTGATSRPGLNGHANHNATSAAADSAVDFVGTKPVRVGRTAYTYDDAGRVVRTVTKRLSRKPLVHEFFYATNEQPIGFISSDNKHLGWRYIYDPYGRRVAKGPDPRKVDTSGVSYAALVSVADVSASKVSGATRLHQECRRRVL